MLPASTRIEASGTSSRPIDEEKWELIEGRFVMQAQPSIDHQIIAGNLDRRLSEGLERIGSDRVVL
ncbi:Uma2 family endonuclease [Methylobacterium sp. E-041]|uniref:Uma2 family endonuclease n=1 Tax=unclassified Methylobacterium TaxID=2615210 RepID=UPI001FB93967|nr:MULTISPECIES: Uma2 family endonuclease [unclassified Methylobacterium]MCJ2039334.1 Uma2 family endonuclease [Methylobacterium sp. J-059]MCJ2106964.1 Uma2 family endonuclease [Methylobacterium sp. E-041]